MTSMAIQRCGKPPPLVRRRSIQEQMTLKDAYIYTSPPPKIGLRTYPKKLAFVRIIEYKSSQLLLQVAYLERVMGYLQHNLSNLEASIYVSKEIQSIKSFSQTIHCQRNTLLQRFNILQKMTHLTESLNKYVENLQSTKKNEFISTKIEQLQTEFEEIENNYLSATLKAFKLPVATLNYKRGTKHDFETPLIVAVKMDDPNLFKVLTRSGARFNNPTLQHIVKTAKSCPKIIQELPYLSTRYTFLRTDLLLATEMACSPQQLNLVKQLLLIRPTLSPNHKAGLLQTAIMRHSLEIIEYLVRNHCDPRTTYAPSSLYTSSSTLTQASAPVETALSLAVRLKKTAIISILLYLSKPYIAEIINKPSIRGVRYQLPSGLYTYSIETKYLLEHCSPQDQEIRKMLQLAGAKPPPTTSLAEKKQIERILYGLNLSEDSDTAGNPLEYLDQHEEAIREIERKNPICLHKAILSGNNEIAVALLSRDISPYKTAYISTKSMPPLILALQTNNEFISQYIIDKAQSEGNLSLIMNMPLYEPQLRTDVYKNYVILVSKSPVQIARHMCPALVETLEKIA